MRVVVEQVLYRDLSIDLKDKLKSSRVGYIGNVDELILINISFSLIINS